MSKLPLLTLSALLAFSASARTDERIPWQHASLEMYLTGVEDEAGRARVELCVRPKEAMSEGSTTVGFPRCRTSHGRWMDVVIAGIDRSRTLRASAEDGPACFSVLVPHDAAELELTLGHRTVDIPVSLWLEEPKREPPTEPMTEVDDPWGRETKPDTVEVEPAEQAEQAEPNVILSEERTVAGASVPVPRDQIVSVHLRARNAGAAAARGVVAWIEPGAGVFAAKDGATRIELGELAPGASSEFVYRCYADRSAATLSFQVTLEQAGTAAASTGTVVSFPLVEAPPPRPVADVDGEIVASLSLRPAALAVVFGVESYAKAPEATFAAADAKTAARYFEKLLGIPASRIELLTDGQVTLGQMQRIFGNDGWLARRVSSDTEIVVFFAGHGMADPDKFSPYLLPADADPDYLHQTAFSLDTMMELIAGLGARKTTVFFDACFSGLTRTGVALLDDARPLTIERTSRVPGGLSVFSAGSKGQIASSLDEQGHGVFSYYLFKGLSGEADLDHDARVLASELASYLEDRVPRAARSLDREQTPGIALADPEEVLVQLAGP